MAKIPKRPAFAPAVFAPAPAPDPSSSSKDPEPTLKPKKTIVKKRKSISPALSAAQKMYKDQCQEVARFCRKAKVLQKQGHHCIKIINEVFPPVLLWCEEKECLFHKKSPIEDFIEGSSKDPKNQLSA